MLNIQIDEQLPNDPVLIWKECLQKIKLQVPKMTYNTWFLPIKPLEFNNSTLKVQLPSQFFWEWIDEHYNTLITKTISEVIGPAAKLNYIIVDEKDNDDQLTLFSNITVSAAPKKIEKNKLPQIETHLNSRYTFDNFIKGEGNQLARAAAMAISDNPGGTSFNPFFVYGGVGLGKTHLIEAIGNKIVETKPDKKVIYISSDLLTVEFVDSIKSNTVNEFSNFYRKMDVLIIDDIQFLTGKEKTQDLFFHIFNTLHQSKKQIVLSSDKPPKDLKGLDERLISRFQWGLTADIQPPELETRIAILKRKAEDFAMHVSNDILEFIASSITSNIRELEGCLIKLLASASLNSKAITIDLARKTVREIATDRKVSVTVESITKVVCNHFSVSEDKLRDKTRKREIVMVRQVAMYLSKEMTRSSLKTIGLHFGGRDHSTVIHSCSTVEEEMIKDRSFKELIDYLRNQVEINCS